jgi:hypothetical protein
MLCIVQPYHTPLADSCIEKPGSWGPERVAALAWWAGVPPENDLNAHIVVPSVS